MVESHSIILEMRVVTCPRSPIELVAELRREPMSADSRPAALSFQMRRRHEKESPWGYYTASIQPGRDSYI